MRHVSRVCGLLAAGVLFLAAQSGPEKVPLRRQISLDTGWRFVRQATPGSAVEWPYRDAWKPGYDASSWTRVFLPHSWDEVAQNPWVRAYFDAARTSPPGRDVAREAR